MKTSGEQITIDTINLASHTLTGDIRDFLLDRMKNFKKPWVSLSEDEQRAEIISSKEAAENLVKKAVAIIASEGRKVIVGHLQQVTVKDEIKAVICIPKTDSCRHELIDSAGQAVLIVVADAEPFVGEQAPAEPMPQQGDLLAANL